MEPNPSLGVVYHWIGGLAAASFYLPYRGVKRWSWETYWLVGGFFSWIIAPWMIAWLLVPDLLSIFKRTPVTSLLWPYCFGVMWGLGGLTFGLTMRYLGIALGVALALGYTAAFGTLMPPIFNGEIREILQEPSGQVILLGVAVCLAGIAVSGLAGVSKERELSPAEKQAAIKEFSFKKGIIVATFSGVMSACFAYGLAAGKPIADVTKTHLLQLGSSDLWQNLPVLIVVLLGGFTTNFVWCVILNIKNRTAHEYLNLRKTAVAEVSAMEAVVPWDAKEIADTGAAAQDEPVSQLSHDGSAPLVNNYILSAVAGVTWYFQFFFYSMGQTKMGVYEFSSWTLHMASIIIFSTLWGVALQEWKGSSRKTHLLIGIGLLVLIASTIVVGYGNFLKSVAGSH